MVHGVKVVGHGGLMNMGAYVAWVHGCMELGSFGILFHKMHGCNGL